MSQRVIRPSHALVIIFIVQVYGMILISNVLLTYITYQTIYSLCMYMCVYTEYSLVCMYSCTARCTRPGTYFGHQFLSQWVGLHIHVLCDSTYVHVPLHSMVHVCHIDHWKYCFELKQYPCLSAFFTTTSWTIQYIDTLHACTCTCTSTCIY